MNPPPFRVAIAGLGTVGSSVVNLLHHHADDLSSKAGRPLVITGLSARNPHKQRSFSTSELPWNPQWYDDPLSMVQEAPADAIIELIGGKDGIAFEVSEAALDKGRHLVSANKAMLAESGETLWEKAEKNQKIVAFEAAVAGGIPIINALKNSLAANKVHHVSGIINGTCNLILSQMATGGGTLQELIKDAQDKGFAEASPEADIEGYDSAHKIALIARIIFGRPVPFHEIPIEGISSITNFDMAYAQNMGFTLKLVGITEQNRNAITVAVFPALVPKNHILYPINGVMNCISVEAEPVGSLSFTGPGAGGGATASSVVADIINLAQMNDSAHTTPLQSKPRPPAKLTPQGEYTCPFYLRFQVPDNYGVLATISRVLSDHLISVHSMSQYGNQPSLVDLVFITHDTPLAHIKEAFKDIAQISQPSSSEPLVSSMQYFRILKPSPSS